jgi:lipopolysaccharide export system permease protein
MEFERYSMRVTTKAQDAGANRAVNAMSTMALLKEHDRYAMAELLWRISAPVSCLILILLAIPLGFVNPRAGSSTNLIIAVLIFFTYSNLIKLLEASVKQGRLSFAMSWWPLHLAAALAVVLLFSWRLNVNHRYHPLVLLARLKRARHAKVLPS